MARVFLSYRRADGRYSVGWIAERLGRLDAVSDVRTAFRDRNLRCGDDFPAALADEVAECDVFVVVIGPNWRGRRDDGSARILDPTDWVGRELTAALERFERGEVVVFPVLVGGAEAVSAAELLPEHRKLADINAKPFNDEAELDEIVGDLKTRLEEIDDARARQAGLAEPIRLHPLRPHRLLVVGALVAGAVAGLLGWLSSGSVDFVTDARSLYRVAVTGGYGIGAALAVLGVAYLWVVFRGQLRIDWWCAGRAIAALVAVFAWASWSYGHAGVVELVNAVVGDVLAAPWIVAIMGFACARPDYEPRELGERVRIVGELDRVGVVAARAGALLLALGQVPAARVQLNAGEGGVTSIAVGAGILSTAALTIALLWNRSRLERESRELKDQIAHLSPVHRQHAEEHLVDGVLPANSWRVTLWLLLPLATGVAVAISSAVWDLSALSQA